MKAVKVALIEDDAAIVDMYATRLRMVEGFEVKVANDGISGLELIKSFSPDIVLLDMMMPRMSGMETLEHLRKLPSGKEMPVIALTNMNDPDTTKALKKYHVVDHIVKADTTPSGIVEKVNAFLNNQKS